MKGAMKLTRVLFGAGAGVGLGIGSSVAMASAKENCGLSYELLRRQNACTSNEVIRCLEGSKAFAELASREGQLMVARDEEDEQKLWVGIEKSIARGVLKKIPPPVVTRIAVYGMTPEEVADHIISQVSTASNGCVIVLQGQSGTGKGTTTTTLLDKLPNSVSWSNGNVFRSLTLLAATHCKNEGIDLKENVDKVWASFPGCVFFCAVVFVIVSVMPPHTPTSRSSTKVMTPENVARWMSMLRFEKIADRKYDIAINGLGLSARVSEIQNTILKEPLVAKNIPTVAEWTQVRKPPPPPLALHTHTHTHTHPLSLHTPPPSFSLTLNPPQGDVVTFASSALEKMAGDGMNVILEGRAATVQVCSSAPFPPISLNFLPPPPPIPSLPLPPNFP